MARLSKKETKLHNEACELLKKDELTFDEKWFVLENWNEGAKHINSSAGAFFTPVGLASDFRIEVFGHKIVDLCAGIGVLSFMAYHNVRYQTPPDITCVEINPDYVEVGKKLLPEANWICGDVFEIWQDLGHFDMAISNPPFGRVVKNGYHSNYTGGDFEYKIIDLASKIADHGSFIIPQESSGFRYSGVQCFTENKSEKYKKFNEQTGIELMPGCGLDTTFYKDEWKGVSPKIEVALADFS